MGQKKCAFFQATFTLNSDIKTTIENTKIENPTKSQ